MKTPALKTKALAKKHMHLLSEACFRELAGVYGLKVTEFEKRAYKTFFYLEMDNVKVGVEYERNLNLINMGQGKRGYCSYASFGGHYSFVHMVEIFKKFFYIAPMTTSVKTRNC